MASNARDAEYDIIANDKTSRGTRSAANNFDKLNDHVSKTSRKIADQAGKHGTSAGMAFGGNMVKAFTRAAAGPAAAVLGGVAIAAAPLIGATISSAIIGGAGVGGVIGGVLLASRDARVQAAATSLGSSIMAQLERSAASFVDPLIDATHEFRASFQRAGGDIDGILRKSATFVRPLTQGITYAFERAASGINKLVQNAEPVIIAIRDGFANVGEAVEDVFDDLSDNGVEAASALNTAFGALEVTIRVIGATVNALTEAFGFLAKWGAFGKDVALQYRAMETSAKHAQAANDGAAGSFSRVGDAAADAGVGIKTYTQTLDEARGNNLSLMEAQARATLAIGETNAKIKENNENYKNSNERMAANKIELVGLVESFDAVRTATAKANGVAVETIGYTDQQRAAFIAAANKAGIYGKKAEDLANELLGIPTNVDPKVKLAAEEAMRDAIETKRHLNAIKGTYNATIKVKVSYAGVKSISAARRAIQEGGGPGGFDAVSHFYAADSSSGERSRSGGPTPVSVTSNVRVDLDGRPFRDYTTRAINANEDRRHWRDKVGKR